MTKADIVDVISISIGLTKVETEAVVNGFMETVIDAMKRGENIELRGFGSFKVVKRAQRVARNPKTNVEVIVPEQFVPILKVSKDFKEAVNESMAVKFWFRKPFKVLILEVWTKKHLQPSGDIVCQAEKKENAQKLQSTSVKSVWEKTDTRKSNF